MQQRGAAATGLYKLEGANNERQDRHLHPHHQDRDERAGEEAEREIPFLKGYTVFNVDQVEGLPSAFYATPDPLPAPAFDRIAQADAFFAATGATIREGGNRAFYSPATDHIQMPPFASFRSAETHASTLAHELTHWTKAPSRLDRDFGRKRFGDEPKNCS